MVRSGDTQRRGLHARSPATTWQLVALVPAEPGVAPYGNARSQRRPISSAERADAGRSARNENHSARAAAARSVTVRQAVRLCVPRIAAATAIRLQGQPALAAICRKHDNRSTRTAASARIIGGPVVSGSCHSP